MGDQSDLVRTAYEQCGVAYNMAVEVSKYTWTMFYTRTAALLAASGYIVLERPRAAWLGGVLLLVGALATQCLTQTQAARNQTVVRKTIAAGLLLERANPKLGYLYRLRARGEQLDETNSLNSLASTPESEDIGQMQLGQLGLTPKFEELLTAYASIQGLLAVIAFWIWAAYHRPSMPLANLLLPCKLDEK